MSNSRNLSKGESRFVNAAGDTMSGVLTLDRIDDSNGVISERRTWAQNDGGTTPYRVLYPTPSWGGEYGFNIYIGTRSDGGQKRYWYLDFNTGASTWMDFLHIEVWSAGWSWTTTSGYRRWSVTSMANSWVTTLREDNASGALGSVSAYAVPNGSTSVRIGFSATSGANSYRIKMSNASDRLRTVTTVNYTDTNPF